MSGTGKRTTIEWKDLRRFVFAGIILWVWNRKHALWEFLKILSVVFLAFSNCLLYLELTSEYLGSERIHKLLSAFSNRPALVFAILTLAVIYLLVHHALEAMKPEYEFRFVDCVCELVELGRSAESKRPPKDLLQLFHSAFKRASIAHVTIHLPNGQSLKIDREHAFPPVDDPEFYIELPPGRGMAQMVFSDWTPRYAPFLLIPANELVRWAPKRYSFPHCVRYSFTENPPKRMWLVRFASWIARKFGWHGADTETGLRIVESGIDLDVFEPGSAKKRHFESVLSVPLWLRDQRTCVGVLNFDFKKADTLSKSDVKMAALLGVFLAEELVTRGLCGPVTAVDKPVAKA